MNHRLRRPRWPQLLVATALSTGLVGTASSCGEILLADPPPPPVPSRPVALQPVRVAQLGFGAEARYALCTDSSCPRVTQKTLPSADEPPATAQVPSPAPAPAVEIVEKTVVVYFASGSAELTAQAQSALDAALPLARASDTIVITGRTDSTGALPVNQALAQARAASVEAYLRAKAASLPASLRVEAQGACCYAAPNASDAGRAQNRRVEVQLTLREEL